MGLETKGDSILKRLVLCLRLYTTVYSQDWDVAVLAGTHARLEKQRRSRLVGSEWK